MISGRTVARSRKRVGVAIATNIDHTFPRRPLSIIVKETSQTVCRNGRAKEGHYVFVSRRGIVGQIWTPFGVR